MKNILFALLCLISGAKSAIILDSNVTYINTTILSDEEFISDFELPLALNNEEFALSFLVLGEFTEPGLNFIAEYNDGSHMNNMITVTNKTPHVVDQIAFIPFSDVPYFNFGWRKDNNGTQYISSLTWQHRGDEWKASAFNFDKTVIPEPSSIFLFILSGVFFLRRHASKSRPLSFPNIIRA